MDIGILFSFRNPAFNRVPWTTTYADELDLTVAAEELGYDHVWLSEHHFVDDGYSPSLLPIAAAVAALTRSIRIGTYVMLLPLHNPVRVAEDAATVDVISGGRFDLGVGLGYRPGEFTGMGIPSSERAARFQEALPVIQRLLAGETLSLDGRFNQFEDVRITPPPAQRQLPIWVGARGDRALERAAQLGCHLASIGAPGHRERYLAALAAHGRRAEDHHIGQLAVVYVAATAAQAWRECGRAIHHVIREYQAWAEESGDESGDALATMAVPPAEEFMAGRVAEVMGRPAMIGDPEQVYQGLRAFLEVTPATHLVLMMALPGMDPERTRNSMELFARAVMPRLKG
ncbi:MAG: LLM class flavin-dependent oxidoreductase [Porticoccaceae bacterium]